MLVAELYTAVYENPSDDGRRRILADALLEQGDVRGELIALQFQTHALARKRANKLIARHRAHFLGPLAGLVVHGTDEWERGFLVSCVARLGPESDLGPAWATVRHLCVIWSGRRAPPELRREKHMRSLKHVRILSQEARWSMSEHFWVHVPGARVRELLARA